MDVFHAKTGLLSGTVHDWEAGNMHTRAFDFRDYGPHSIQSARLSIQRYSLLGLLCNNRGRILGRNPNKSLSLKIFPPCNSQSPLQLWLEIYISSNSRNLLQFQQFWFYTRYGKGERRKTWSKTIPPSLCFNKSIQKPQVGELCLETSTKLYVHEFGFGDYTGA